MHRPTLIAALAGATFAAALLPARADAPGDGWRQGHPATSEHPSRSRHHVWRGGAAPGAYARREAPPAAPVAFDASPAYGVAVPARAPQAIFVELREPYLPHGVVYNVPPDAAFGAPRAVIRARY